jgi:hypothetical protein
MNDVTPKQIAAAKKTATPAGHRTTCVAFLRRVVPSVELRTTDTFYQPKRNLLISPAEASCFAQTPDERRPMRATIDPPAFDLESNLRNQTPSGSPLPRSEMSGERSLVRWRPHHPEDPDMINPPRRDEQRQTEDEIARAHLGDRGVPGVPFPIREMTPERKKKTPLCALDPGHTA